MSLPCVITEAAGDVAIGYTPPARSVRARKHARPSENALRQGLCVHLESLGFAQNFLSSCELEALHFIGIGSFGEEFREDVVFRGIQEQFRKPLA